MFDFIKSAKWNLLRKKVLERDRYVCQYCGSIENLTVDHIWPKSKGGKDEMSNLITACRSCNYTKHDKTLREWIEGKRTEPLDEPPTIEKITKTPSVQLVIHHTDTVEENVEIDIPYMEKMREFSMGILEGKAISQAVWSGSTKLFSRREFDDLIDILMKQGLLEWRSSRWHNQGVRPTQRGATVFRTFAQIAQDQEQDISSNDQHLNNASPTEKPDSISLENAETLQLPEDTEINHDSELMERAIQIIRLEGRASVSMLQRKLRVGYSRASRIMDKLEEDGVVGPGMSAGLGRVVLPFDAPKGSE